MQKSILCEWIVLQLTDTSFPAGSLGNSNGLESAVAHGIVKCGSARSLFEFIVLVLEQSAKQMLPFLRASYRAVQRNEQDTEGVLTALDAICHSNISDESSIRSSITQGKCFLKACEACFGNGVYNSLVSEVSSQKSNFTASANAVEDIDGRDRADKFERVVACLNQSLEVDTATERDGITSSGRKVMEGHYPVVFGALSAALDLPLAMACRAFMRCMLRDACSCATRLNVVGPLEGASIQAKLSTVVEQMISANDIGDDSFMSKEVLCDNIFGAAPLRGLFSEIPTTNSPIVDLVKSRHDILYSRLFNS